MSSQKSKSDDCTWNVERRDELSDYSRGYNAALRAMEKSPSEVRRLLVEARQAIDAATDEFGSHPKLREAHDALTRAEVSVP